MITLHLRYFAVLREALGEAQTLQVPSGSSVAQVRQILQTLSPQHAQALAPHQVLRCAMNQQLCDESTLVQADAQLAFFPPVTGG
jgi:sulfur-carrier protein